MPGASKEHLRQSDIFDFVVNQGNGIKGLSQMGLKRVPELYVQAPGERLEKHQIVEDESIPIIDVSNWDDKEVASSICEAATKWGFFQIINHEIPLRILENVRNAGHKFFELPNEERKKYLEKNSPTPDVHLKTSTSPSSEKALEWKDYLSHRYVPEDDQSCEFWHSATKDEVLEYITLARPVIRKIIEVLLEGLNVKEIDEEKKSVLMGVFFISLVYYPICPNPELTSGAGPHSDISSITVLLQDDIGGLYVRGTKPDTWIHVTPIPGALVINIGDAFQMASNDRYKSVEHRVIVNGRKNRVSVPIFVNASPEAVISPFEEVLNNGEKPAYRPVRFSDYFDHFFSKGHRGKKALEFAKI